jgi:hypothetical protein
MGSSIPIWSRGFPLRYVIASFFHNHRLPEKIGLSKPDRRRKHGGIFAARGGVRIWTEDKNRAAEAARL